MDCDMCARIIEKKVTCGYCKKTQYCSSSCKLVHTNSKHKASMPRNLRSVDYLYIDVFDNEFPTNEKTIKDYGFANCNSQAERINLLGLYIGLLRMMGLPTAVLHEYCMKDEIADLIKREYGTLPMNSRGGYYPWFLQNQHIVKNGNKGKTNAVEAEHVLQNLSVTSQKKPKNNKAKPSAKFSIQDGKFIINYGYDAAESYYYLNVQDPRLAWRSGLADNVEKVTNDIDTSGEGVIMQLHTCASTSKIKGNQVSAETLAVFYKSYGISNSHIEKMKQGKSF